VLRERVLKKLHHRQMPPVGEERPDEATCAALVTHLAGALDRAKGPTILKMIKDALML